MKRAFVWLKWLIGTLLFFYLVWHFFWVIPNQKLATERITPSWKRELTQKESHELQNSFRQTLVQALGGAALLLGLYFTARTLRISQETLRVAQEGLITERFAQAIELLGNKDSLMVSLGGVYALERIARDSDRDHWPIMEVLTAYVRDNALWRPEELQQPRPTLTTIQPILTVIGRRTRSPNREDTNRLDLSHTDLRLVDLSGAHLEGANLSGANLSEAKNLTSDQLQTACGDQQTRLPGYLEGVALPSCPE